MNVIIFSPDGKLLAYASERTVRVWDISKGVVRQILEGLDGYWGMVKAVTFSPDGGSNDNTIKMWDLSS